VEEEEMIDACRDMPVPENNAEDASRRLLEDAQLSTPPCALTGMDSGDPGDWFDDDGMSLFSRLYFLWKFCRDYMGKR
jgi:hypothetical protein